MRPIISRYLSSIAFMAALALSPGCNKGPDFETKPIEIIADAEEQLEDLLPTECQGRTTEYLLTEQVLLTLRKSPRISATKVGDVERFDTLELCSNEEKEGWHVIRKNGTEGWAEFALDDIVLSECQGQDIYIVSNSARNGITIYDKAYGSKVLTYFNPREVFTACDNITGGGRRMIKLKSGSIAWANIEPGSIIEKGKFDRRIANNVLIPNHVRLYENSESKIRTFKFCQTNNIECGYDDGFNVGDTVYFQFNFLADTPGRRVDLTKNYRVINPEGEIIRDFSSQGKIYQFLSQDDNHGFSNILVGGNNFTLSSDSIPGTYFLVVTIKDHNNKYYFQEAFVVK
ncbi:MAG: SH3 domain-containing protein [archaeon]|nr:hypothetical protein [Nanoarchaeota archaeon]